MCVLAEPAFDPYTNEPCGPLITHKDIDEIDNCYSQKSIDALVASLDVNDAAYVSCRRTRRNSETRRNEEKQCQSARTRIATISSDIRQYFPGIADNAT
jgi:hypothetical protein